MIASRTDWELFSGSECNGGFVTWASRGTTLVIRDSESEFPELIVLRWESSAFSTLASFESSLIPEPQSPHLYPYDPTLLFYLPDLLVCLQIFVM